MGNKYHRHQRREMLPFLPATYCKVLEVGCGTGVFVSQLDQSAEIWGIELSKVAAEEAEQRLYRVIQGAFEDVHMLLPQGYFDLIICNDVIEHIADHDSFLDIIKQKLSPVGVLVASIPNVRHWKNIKELLFEADWRYRDAGILDRTHLRFFTEKSIRRTFMQHGFELESFAGINKIKWKRYPLLCLLALLTFGKSADMRSQQFGLRARLNNSIG